MALEVVLTEEQIRSLPEQLQVAYRIVEALDRDDEDEALEWQKKLSPPAEVLLAAKEAAGAEWVKKQGYITREADEMYGAGWLDK